jgi:hypothetical protein
MTTRTKRTPDAVAAPLRAADHEVGGPPATTRID